MKIKKIILCTNQKKAFVDREVDAVAFRLVFHVADSGALRLVIVEHRLARRSVVEGDAVA